MPILTKLALLRYIVLVGVLLAPACTSDNSADKTPRPPLKIGVNPWAGYAAVYIAEDQGFFDDEGIAVELINYQVYSQALTDLAQRTIDGNTMVFSDAFGLAAAGSHVQFVWVTDNSAGGDVLIANADINSVEDLKGKRVGMSIGTYSQVFVASSLAQHDLTLDDVTVINTLESELPAAWVAGEVDAGHTYDPFMTEALDQGAKILTTSADTPGVIVDGLFLHEDIITYRSNDVHALVRALNRALEWWADNNEAGNVIIAKWMGIQPEAVPAALALVKIFSLQDNLIAFDPATEGPESLLVIGELAVNLFAEAGVIQQKPNVASLINADFVNKLAN